MAGRHPDLIRHVSYADQLGDALAGEPYLRAALALFADMVRAAGGGPTADVGCGPGHVTARLQELGVDVFGIDLSPAMVDVARRDYPGLRFEVGSMTDLRLADASVAGLLAFWSLVHIPDDEVPAVFGHFRRVLRPGGSRYCSASTPTTSHGSRHRATAATR